MRAQLLVATALSSTMSLLVPGLAAAQDLKGFDWSGFYVGANVGVVRSTGTADLDYPGGPPPGSGFGFSGNNLYRAGSLVDADLPKLFKLNSVGSIGGLDAGFNMQSGAFVFGLEGDLSAVDGTGASRTGTSTSGGTVVNVTTSLDALMTARARAGIAVDRLMFFATAGLAVGHSSLGTDLNYSDLGKSVAEAGKSGGLVPGVVGGLGAEYALSDKVSVKTEALYYWLPGQSATATGSGIDGGPVPAQPYSVTNNQSGVLVRAGIDFHF